MDTAFEERMELVLVLAILFSALLLEVLPRTGIRRRLTRRHGRDRPDA